jgi:DNA polymerase I-like protein with 3'-5' exonuclease and polymerase domains
MDALLAGDVYIDLAVRAGLAPRGATKVTHEAVRAMCKVAMLGTRYGMQHVSLARQTGLHEIEARSLLRRLDAAYPVYAEWAGRETDLAQLRGWQSTVFGWLLHVSPEASSNSSRNFPMQAGGAEMLRLACCLASEAGVMVCAPVHDALLIEAADDEIDGAVDTTRKAMAQASRIVLDGTEIPTDAKIVRWPDRYADPRGADMWQRVMTLLAATS